MSEALSQEEIDAILKGSLIKDVDKRLMDEEAQALSEVFNIEMSVLSEFLLSKIKKKVVIQTQQVSIMDTDGFHELDNPMLALSVELKGGLEGKLYFVYKMDDVAVLNDLLIGGDGTNLDGLEEIQTDVVLGVMNDVLPEILEKITSIVKSKITSKPLEVFEAGEKNSNIRALVSDNQMVQVTCSLEITNAISAKFYQLLPLPMAKGLVNLLLEEMGDDASDTEDSVESNLAYGNPKTDRRSKKRPEKNPPVKIQGVSFPSFDDSDDIQGYDENIDFILDVPLRISVELGSTQRSIKDILNLNIGSIVELDNLAEDYVDILVNGKLIARGEVIVVDENFGVRIMELYTNNRKSLLEKD